MAELSPAFTSMTVPFEASFSTFPISILLVDDKPENLLALSAALSDEGFDLVEASSGREALDKVREQDFAAILMDVQMPELDGFETARRMRKETPAKTTPILFVTAIHRTEAHALKGYDVGAIDYIFKPLDTDILRAKLRIFVELFQKTLQLKTQNQSLSYQIQLENEKLGLKEAIEARDEFLSMATHELKTPITPLNLQMQSFLKMVKNKTLKSIDDEKLERMLQNSYSQVERLSETIDKLLDVSRFTVGRIEMNFEKVNLTELIKKTNTQFAIQLQNLKCRLVFSGDEDVFGTWDPFRIQQVYINLLSNSMRYGPGQPIHVSVRQLGDQAVLQVRDQGTGIAPEDQERIFRRFEKASSPTNYGGLGLGLYIACEIIRHHHGSIHVNSQKGKGAEFTVKLPLQTSQKQVQVDL